MHAIPSRRSNGIVLKEERGTDPRTTALLLAADFEVYNAIPGDSEACRAAVALPEQLFRV